MSDNVKLHEAFTLSISFILLFFLVPNLLQIAKDTFLFMDEHEGTAQVLVALTTAFFAYWIPHRYRKNEEQIAREARLFRYNEAVVYFAVLVEDAIHAAEKVVEADEHERIVLEKMEKRIHPNSNGEKINFLQILPFMSTNIENNISKIVDPGKHFEIIQILYRIDKQIKQHNLIAEERRTLLSELNKDMLDPIKEYSFNKRYVEIHHLTQDLLMCIEVIIDHGLFVLQEFNIISEGEREKTRQMGIKSIPVCKISNNPFHEQTRLLLRGLIDQIPQFNPRLLHLPETARF